MNHRIGRRVKITICQCLSIGKDNNVREEEVKLIGDYKSIERAQNAARKMTHNNRLIVKSMTQDSYYASMPVQKFLDNCDKVSRTENVNNE